MPQQGFQYEVNVYEALKPLGFVPSNFRPAGAAHDRPDLMLLYKNQTAGCELKITDASAGSLVIKYDTTKGLPYWRFGKIKPEETEKLFIAEVARNSGVFSRITKEWTEVPYRREGLDDLWKATAGKMTARERYQRDLKIFRDISGEIPATDIEMYYNEKKTYYVNIGTHGFYLMGPKNPFGVAGIPRFGQSAKAKWRARVQYKGSDAYQFTFEMQFSMKIKSPYNISPCTKQSVTILKDKIDLSFFNSD